MPSSLASRDKLESHCPQDLSLRNCDAELWWPLLGAMRGCTILWGGRCCGAAWRPLLTPSSLLLRLCSSSEIFWLNSLPPPQDLAKWVYLFVCLSVHCGLSVCLSVCTCGRGQDITERSGVQWAQQTCLLPVRSNALLPSMPVCLCHQNWTLLPRPHQLSHVVCRSC